MKRQALLTAALLALPFLAHAEEMEDVAMAEESEMAEESAYPSYEFQGWLDQSINFDQGTEEAAHGMFEVAIRAGHEINENFGGFLQINGRWNQTLTVTGGGNAMAIAPREAYAYWQNDMVRIQAGKWYVPIGFELADPPDLYQYSNSNQFGFFLPTEAIGVISYLTLSDSIDLALYLAGTTDDDFATLSTKALPTIGERLGISFGDAGVGLSLVVSDSVGDDSYNSILLDLDFAAELDDLTLGGEFSLLTDTDTGGATDFGVMGMASYGLTDRIIATGRVDFLTGDSFADPEVGITAAGLFNLADGWDLVLEVREDINDGGGTTDNLTAAFELIYQFL